MQTFLFELSEAVCPECGIPMHEDYLHYGATAVARAHRAGTCYACRSVNYVPPGRSHRVIDVHYGSVSNAACARVWYPGFTGIGKRRRGHRHTDCWPAELWVQRALLRRGSLRRLLRHMPPAPWLSPDSLRNAP